MPAAKDKTRHFYFHFGKSRAGKLRTTDYHIFKMIVHVKRDILLKMKF